VQQIDEVIDALYSVDIADVSFQLGSLTFKPMQMMMQGAGKSMTDKLTKLAKANPDLKNVYEEAITKKATKH